MLPDAIAVFATAEIARRWVDILGRKAFSKKLISAIPASGFDAEGYLRWREAGLAESDALTLPPKLAGAGLKLDDYRRWQSAGFTADELTKLSPKVKEGLNFDDALGALQCWYHFGESSANGAVFEFREILRDRTMFDLRRLITNDFSGHQVFMWFRSGIPETAWAEWKQTGIVPWKTAGLVRLGISPATAKQWAEAGLDASDIEEFNDAGIPLDDALAWVGLPPFGGHPDRLGDAPAGEDALMGAKRKSYTPKFRAEAARLVIDTGRTIAEVAREIGVGEALLGRWVAIERAKMEDPPEALDADERAELTRLRREVADLRIDRAFLKKAAAFFATENSNPNGHSR